MQPYEENLEYKEEASGKSSTVSAYHKEATPLGTKHLRRRKKKRTMSSKKDSDQEEMYQIIVTNSNSRLEVGASGKLERPLLSQADATSSNCKKEESSVGDHEEVEPPQDVMVLKRESMLSVL